MPACTDAVTTNKLTASEALRMHEQHYESLETTKRMRRVKELADDPKIAEPLIDLIDEKIVGMTTALNGKVLTFRLVLPYGDTKNLKIEFESGEGEQIEYFELPAVRGIFADHDVDPKGDEMHWLAGNLFNGHMWEYLHEEYSKRGYDTSWWTTKKPEGMFKEDGYAEYRIDYCNPTDATRGSLLDKIAEDASAKQKKSLLERIFGR